MSYVRARIQDRAETFVPKIFAPLVFENFSFPAPLLLPKRHLSPFLLFPIPKTPKPISPRIPLMRIFAYFVDGSLPVGVSIVPNADLSGEAAAHDEVWMETGECDRAETDIAVEDVSEQRETESKATICRTHSGESFLNFVFQIRTTPWGSKGASSF